MEELQTSTTAEAAPKRSLIARLTDVFITPGEVFDEVKAGPAKPSNWIVPLLLAILLSAVYSIVAFSQPAVIQQLREAQDQKLEQMVKQGKLTQQQADQSAQMLEKFSGPKLMTIFGVIGSVFWKTGEIFLIPAVMLLLGRLAFRAQFEYMRGVEVCGLSMMITTLGAVVSIFLVVIFGNMLATPSPALLVKPLVAGNKLHASLAALNLFTLWYVGLLAIGLARLSGVGVLKPALWLYSLWALVTFAPILSFSK